MAIRDCTAKEAWWLNLVTDMGRLPEGFDLDDPRPSLEYLADHDVEAMAAPARAELARRERLEAE